MKFEQTTRRERILLYGSYKLGKSTAWLDIADTHYRAGNTDVHFYIIDTDFGVDKMLDEGYGHLDDAGMLTVYYPNSFEDLQKAGREISENAGRGDWIVIDMLEYAWTSAQDFYSIGVYGQQPENYFLQMRKEVVAKKGKDKRAYGGHEGTDWGWITQIYKRWEFPLTMKTKANVFGVSGEQKLDADRGSSADEIKRFKGVGGMKPVGQKGIGHRFDTVLRMTQRASGQRQITMAGDRGKTRGETWDKRGSNVLDINGTEQGFAQAYLVDIAGWTLDKGDGGRNDSKASKGKKKKKDDAPIRRRRK